MVSRCALPPPLKSPVAPVSVNCHGCRTSSCLSKGVALYIQVCGKLAKRLRPAPKTSPPFGVLEGGLFRNGVVRFFHTRNHEKYAKHENHKMKILNNPLLHSINSKHFEEPRKPREILNPPPRSKQSPFRAPMSAPKSRTTICQLAIFHGRLGYCKQFRSG